MRYLGIDYGLKKVGLSISDGQIASPYKVLEISGLNDALNKILDIIEKEDIEWVVVGISESGIAKKATEKFIQGLNSKTKSEIIKFDETLTTQDAKKLMLDLNISKKKRNMEDAYSAVLILQNFLDSLS